MIKKLLKILTILILLILLLMVIIWVALQNSGIQGKVADYITGKLGDDLNTELSIKSIDIDFFKTIDIRGIYIEDTAGDSLLYVDHLYANISLFSIFKSRLLIDEVVLEGANINIGEINGIPNYQFLIDHFKSDTPTSSSNPWDISIKKIEIDKSKIDYQSNTVSLVGDISKFNAKISKFDINNLVFDVVSATLDDSSIELIKSTEVKFPELTDVADGSDFPSMTIDLTVQNAIISKSNFLFKNGSPQNTDNKLNVDDLDIAIDLFSLKNLNFHDIASGEITQLIARDKSGLNVKKTNGKVDFTNERITIKELLINTSNSKIEGEVSILYDDFRTWTLDYNNSLIEAKILPSNISTKDIFLLSNLIDLKTISGTEVQNINIEGFLAKNYNLYNFTGIKLKVEQYLTLEGKGSFDFRSKMDLSPLDFNITKLKTSAEHINKIFPSVTIPSEVYNLGNISVITKGNGILNRITIDTVKIFTDTKSTFAGSGMINGLPYMDSLNYNLKVDNFSTLVSEITKDSTILIPELERLGLITYKGNIEGNLINHHINGRFKTEVGEVAGNVFLDTPSKESTSYRGYIELDKVDLGYILQDTTYGKTSLAVNFNGKGIDKNGFDIDLDGKIISTYYNGYYYDNIELDGKIDSLSYDGTLKVKNDNLSIDYNGKIDLSTDHPSFQFEIDLDTFNLTNLGITDRNIRLKGRLTSKMSGDNLDAIHGNMKLKDFKIYSGENKYVSPSDITLLVNNIPGNNKNIILQSPIMDFTMSGYIIPSELIQTIETYIDHYFQADVIDSTFLNIEDYKSKYQNQIFDISLVTKDVNPLLHLFSEDISIKKLTLESQFDSFAPLLVADGIIDSLKYGDYTVNKGDLKITGGHNTLSAILEVDKISNNEDIIIPRVSINAFTIDNEIDLNIDLRDENDKPRLLVGSMISVLDDHIMMNFHDSIIINNERWNIDANNLIKYKDENLDIANLKFNKKNQNLLLFSELKEDKKNIKLDLDQFLISEITKIIGKEDDFFSGKINGTISVNDLYNERFITTDLSVDSLAYRDDPIGRLSLDAKQNKGKNTIEGTFDLVGKKNDALGMLQYNINSKQMDGFLEVSKMEMRLIDPFLTDIISDSDGFLFGDFQIKGTPAVPDISGNLLFDNASTKIIFSQTRYKIKQQKITFDKENINLGKITLYDQNDREAIISGTISHNSFDNLYLDLKADAKGVQFLNTTTLDNSLFYGKIYLDATVDIKGPPEDLKLNAVAKTVNNSTLTLSPFSNIEELIKDDFITFGNPEELKKDSTKMTILKKDKFPVDVNMSLALDEDADFTFIVDPVTGDRLEASGIANLNIQMKKNGEILLFGTYTATDGNYVFSYGVIEKNFSIEKGGTVIFNGDPLEAKLNIDAVYQTYTSFYDLIKGEITSDSEIIAAQKRSYVDVILNLAGDILTPQITIDIQLPTDEKTAISDEIDRKLLSLRSNPNELNNQVFGLLLFDSFIVTDNSSSGFDSATESLVLGSVSSLITNQLNKIASELIKGVELNFNVNNYTSKYSENGGLTTELGVGLSKGFLDDRLTLKAGGNFNLESSSDNTEFSSLAGDFVLEYKLNERGNYILKAFNKTNSDRLIDENNTKTGISIFIKKDLD